MNEIILSKIKHYETIILHRHTRPDGDCMGSQIGLKEMIKTTYPKKKVYVVGDETEEFAYLGRMDSLPDSVYQHALVIILDVANKDRISDQRFLLSKEQIKIDHHPKREAVCEIEWVDPTYASCCEMIADFYYHHKDELSLSNSGAKALYYGMVTDTNRFATPSITPRSLRLASLMLEFTFNPQEIYQNIYDEDLNVTQLKGYVLNHFTVTTNGLAYAFISKEICEQYQVDASLSNILVNVFSNIKHVKIWFVAIYDDSTEQVRISLRSRALAINQIAEQFGGGGHKNASGILVQDFEKAQELAESLERFLAN